MKCSQKGCHQEAHWEYVGYTGRVLYACSECYRKLVRLYCQFEISITGELLMPFQITKGVEMPQLTKHQRDFSEVFAAIQELEPGDPCAVKIEFDDKAEMNTCVSHIYKMNTALNGAKYRYSVTRQKEIKTIWVTKIKV